MNAPFDLTRMIAGDAASTETPLMIANVSRRKFLQGASALGGLVLAVGLPASLRAEGPPKYGADGMPHGWGDNPLVFVAIGQDGIVSIVCHRSEMGQGVRTGMPMIVADELEADWARVRVVQAPGDEVRYGNQDTDGSRSTRHFFMPMRRCGAAARQMLETAAAARWQVPVAEVSAQRGEILHSATGRRLGFGALAQVADEPAVLGRLGDVRIGVNIAAPLEVCFPVSLHRQRQGQATGCAGHGQRPGEVRH